MKGWRIAGINVLSVILCISCVVTENKAITTDYFNGYALFGMTLFSMEYV